VNNGIDDRSGNREEDAERDRQEEDEPGMKLHDLPAGNTMVLSFNLPRGG
jgi:hypothetical protein